MGDSTLAAARLPAPGCRHVYRGEARAHPAPTGAGTVGAAALGWNGIGMTAARWMALCFAVGSLCFLVGPFPGYEQLVGAQATGVTFFVGSIFFTAGGALQTALAYPDRRAPGAGRA